MKIKIGSFTWKVEFCDASDRRLNHEDIAYCGLTNKIALVILINASLKDDLIERTIIHELSHAYIWSYGFENVDFGNEESVCNFIETFGREIINDKDKILKFLRKKK